MRSRCAKSSTLLVAGLALAAVQAYAGDLVVDGDLVVSNNAWVQKSFFLGPEKPPQTGSIYSINAGYKQSGTLLQNFTYKGGVNLGVVGGSASDGFLVQSNRGYLGINIAYSGGCNPGSGYQVVDNNTQNGNESLGINLANFTFTCDATQRCGTGIQYGHFVSYGGKGGLQYNWQGMNFGGIVDGGYQINKTGAGANMGYVSCYSYKGAGNARQEMIGGAGNFNFGYVEARLGYKAVQAISNGSGCLNMGHVKGGTQVAKGDGCGNFGLVREGEYQFTSGSGSYSFGSNISNLYEYAYVFGYGLKSHETNSLVARRIWEGDEPLDQKYARLDYIPPQGDISMGSYTNGAE